MARRNIALLALWMVIALAYAPLEKGDRAMFEIGKLTNIPLGYVGEDVSRSYEIDVSEWLEEFPGATIVVQCLRPVDKLKYFASTELQNGVLTWTVDAMEVKYAGRGFAQFAAINLKTGQEYKSRIVNITVAASLEEFNEEVLDAEDPAQKWVTKVLQAAEDANTAVDKMPIVGENGNWLIWDADEGKHVDSGFAAVGTCGCDGEDGQSGVGIQEIQQTQASTADGGDNVWTAILTDGRKSNFTVKNGSKGSTGTRGPTGAQGDKGDAGYTPIRGVDYWTEADREKVRTEAEQDLSGPINTQIAAKMQLMPEYANSVEDCTDTDKLYVLPDGFIYAYMYGLDEDHAIRYEAGEGGYWNAHGEAPTGEWAETASCCGKRTNIVKVMPGDQFSYMGNATESVYSVIWLKADQTILAREKYSALAEAVTVTAPEEAAYVWFNSFAYTNSVNNVILRVEWILCQGGVVSYRWTNTGHAFVPADYEDRIVSLEGRVKSLESFGEEETTDSPLKDKLLIYDGDSIAESRFGSAANGGAYPALIAEMTGGEYINLAVGGGTLASNTSHHSVVDSLTELPKNGDLYCFEGGINDYWTDVPIGTVTDGYTDAVDTSTVCGALETIFRYALDNFAGKPVCFVITHKIQKTATSENNNGDTFKDFRDAMVAVCEKYSIPYYDAFMESGLNGWNTVQSEAFLTAGSSGVADGCHPNEEGYRVYYVPQLLALFEKIMPQ